MADFFCFCFLSLRSTYHAWVVTCVYRGVSSASRNDTYIKCNRRIWWRQTAPPALSCLCNCFNLGYQVPTGAANRSLWNVHINNSLMCPVLYHKITARDVALLNRNASKAACERDTLELAFYHFHQFRYLNLGVATITFSVKQVEKYGENCVAVGDID